MLIIHGRVSSFFEKQQAQEAICGVAGVAGIVNDVSVQPMGEHDEGEAGSFRVATAQVGKRSQAASDIVDPRFI